MTNRDWRSYSFVELRHALGFGPRRLRWLLWLKEHPELEEGPWAVIGTVGGQCSVKIRLIQGGLAMEEVGGQSTSESLLPLSDQATP